MERWTEVFVPRQSSRRRHVERPDEARLFGEGMKTGYGSTKSGEVLDTWKRCHDSHEPHVSVAVEEKGTSSPCSLGFGGVVVLVPLLAWERRSGVNGVGASSSETWGRSSLQQARRTAAKMGSGGK